MFNGDSGLPTAFNTSVPTVLRRDEAVPIRAELKGTAGRNLSFTNHTGITRYNLSCTFGDVAVPEMTLFVLNSALQV